MNCSIITQAFWSGVESNTMLILLYVVLEDIHTQRPLHADINFKVFLMSERVAKFFLPPQGLLTIALSPLNSVAFMARLEMADLCLPMISATWEMFQPAWRYPRALVRPITVLCFTILSGISKQELKKKVWTNTHF